MEVSRCCRKILQGEILWMRAYDQEFLAILSCIMNFKASSESHFMVEALSRSVSLQMCDESAGMPTRTARLQEAGRAVFLPTSPKPSAHVDQIE